MDNGWIKLHRRITKWEWYQDSRMVHLFLHLLLIANHEPRKWQGIIVQRGQLISGRLKLSQETGISEMTIRTCLKKLKSTNEITIKSTNRYSVITICNYETYQDSNQTTNQLTNQQLTSNQPATNQQLTSNQPATNQQLTSNQPATNQLINQTINQLTNQLTNQQLTNNQPATNHKQEVQERKESTYGIKKFEKIWQIYPKRDGKKAAIRSFNASVKTEKNWIDINLALKNYLNSKDVKKGYIKNGSTWFANWEDWIEYLEPEEERKVQI